jgi:hypothetical protein
MKKYKLSILFLFVFLAIQGINAQSVFNLGGHSILFSEGNYFEVVNSTNVPLNTDMILVKFKTIPSESFISTFETTHSLSFAHVTKSGIYRFDVNPNKNFIDLVTELSNDNAIADFNLNQLLSYMSYPDDSYDYIQSQILVFYPNLLWPYVNTQLFEAWDISSGDPSVTVCILDNGLYLEHEDLNNGSDNYSNIWTNNSEIPDNNYDDDQNGYEDDYHGWNFASNNNTLFLYNENLHHGTALAGIIAAKANNEIGIYGVAGGYGRPGVKILPLLIGNSDPNTALLPQAIEYAIDKGAKIINMSFGGSAPLPSLVESQLQDAYNNYDIVLVAAAGLPCSDLDFECIAYPAKYDFVIAVGATDQSVNNSNLPEQRLDGGTATGSELEIMAPAGSFRTTYDKINQSSSYTFTTDWGKVSYATAFASGVVALMRSANPCLTNEEIREILRDSSDKIGEVAYDSYGHNIFYGYGRVNALRALKTGLGSSSPESINTTITWTGEKKLYFDVNIQANGVLNITDCNLNAGQNAKIIVEPGGKLIVNNSILTSLCDVVYWAGIEVWGNNVENQFPNSNGQYMQGYVELNNAVIENAVCALNLWRPGDDYSTTGGIVHATKTVFKNNVKSLHALLYKNFHPVNGKEMEYNAWFDNCSFEITANYLGSRTFFKHIDLNQVNGIRFQGCDFSLSPDARGISHYNSAISSYSSGFKVSARCTGLTYPCNEFDRSTFTGFQCAISASNGSFKPYTFAVNRADFNNNSIGINVEGVNNQIIINSKFYLSKNDYSYESCSYGIYLNSSTGFSIEENKFFKASGAPLADYFGIAVINCPTKSNIYKNGFSGLSAGNYSYGNSYTGITPFQGLTYSCNRNSDNYADFYITGNSDPSKKNYGIQFLQGSEYLPAGNKFSSNAAIHIHNDEVNLIDYFYCLTCPNEMPDKDKIGFVSLHSVNVSNSCLSHYGGNNGQEIVKDEQQKIESEIAFATASINFQNVESLFNSLKDGGDTDSKVSEISNANPEDMWTLRAELLGNSPHLSEEVLKSVADKTNVFTEAIIFDILAANPDELKKEVLIKYLEEKDNPLPEYMIDILRQVASGITYKTVLLQEMAAYNLEKSQLANDMIRSLLNEAELDVVQLRNWLDNLGGIESDKQIISTYIHENDYISAFSLANILPQLYNLQGNHLVEFNHYLDILQLKQTLYNENRSIENLTQTENAILTDIAENSEGDAGSQARSILVTFYGQHYNNCKSLSDGELSFKNQIINTNLLGEAYGLSISVKPNPAKYFAAFDYVLPNQESSAILEIRDITGVCLASFNLYGNMGQKIWDTRNVPSGSYIFTIKVDGFTKSGKLIISN